MIVFEASREPQARAGEEDIGGRRIAGRLLPYGAEGDPRRRFDPLARRFLRGKPDATVSVGPPHAEAWRAAASRLPNGPVLVGPGSAAEDIRGAYRAAAEGALALGRAVFLLDPPPSGIPEAVAGAVALCSFAPGTRAFPALAAARARGLACGVLFPLIPGWTAEDDALGALLEEAVAGGASAATAIVPEADGDARRSIVEARSEPDAAADETFFDAIHHREWVPAMLARLEEVRRRCAALGLSALPPRPAGSRETAAQAAAAARLEELAELGGLPEHRAAAARAAVRWIDECGRDLAAVAREGNFRKIFPFEEPIATAALAALEVEGAP